MAATPYGCCALGYLLLLSALAGCFGSGSALQVDCVVSPWSAWTACSKTCGEGAQGRTRMINTESQGEGSKCPALSDSQACNTECCPVSCSVTLWSEWGACSKSCGSGTRSRSRSVTTPDSCGGAGCPAGQTGSESCNTAACPGDKTCAELGNLREFSHIGNHEGYLPGCFQDVQTKFILHQRGNRECIIADQSAHLDQIRNCSTVMPEHLVVIAHGFTGSSKNPWVGEMWRKILLEDPRGDVAVLVVDWEHGARKQINWLRPTHLYHPAAANTRYVGRAIERIVSQLNPTTTHCIGHSLGAHVCGFAGQAFLQNNRTMDRISGIDPAGPLFLVGSMPGRKKSISSADGRLDPTDARYVNVLHTDGDLLGTMVPLGHTDFYGGGSRITFGWRQGCCTETCDHKMAVDTYTASIKGQPLGYDTFICSVTLGGNFTRCDSTPSDHTPQYGYFDNGSQPGVYGLRIPTVLGPECSTNLGIVAAVNNVCSLLFSAIEVFGISLGRRVCENREEITSSEVTEILNQVSTMHKEIKELHIKLKNLDKKVNDLLAGQAEIQILVMYSIYFQTYRHIKRYYDLLETDSNGLFKRDHAMDDFQAAALTGRGVGGYSLKSIRNAMLDMVVGENIQKKRIFKDLPDMCHDYAFKDKLMDIIMMEAIAYEMDSRKMATTEITRFRERLVVAEEQYVKDCGCEEGKILARHNVAAVLVRQVTCGNSTCFQCGTDGACADANIQWSSEVMQETVALVERLHSSQSSEDAMLHDGRTFCALRLPDPRLIMLGGYPTSSVGRLVETFPPSSSLSIPSLPQSRYYHSLTLLPGPPARLVVCGGRETGMEAWQQYYTLRQERWHHSAARIGPDIMILGGAGTAATTAEIVPGGGQFDLQHDSYAACAIALEDTGEVVLTGGGGSTPHGHVSRYSSTGFLGSLPDLRQGRNTHACGAFKTQGLTVLLVTGGWGESSRISSTEVINLSTGTAWTLAAPLPQAMYGPSGASMAGGLYVAGGRDGSRTRDEVFRYVQEDGEDDRWEEVGRMANSRYAFAMVGGNTAALSP